MKKDATAVTRNNKSNNRHLYARSLGNNPINKSVAIGATNAAKSNENSTSTIKTTISLSFWLPQKIFLF